MEQEEDRRADLIIVPVEEEDFIKCMRYVEMRDMGTKTTQIQIAKVFGIDRSTLYEWVKKWEISGLLARCRHSIFMGTREEIHAAISSVTQAFPDILARQQAIALRSHSDKQSLESSVWLYENFVKPALNEVIEEGQAEQVYIRKKSQSGNFDPLQIGSRNPKEEESL